MRRIVFAILVIVTEAQSAPAPILRERAPTRSPYEAMITRLQQSGTVTGPCPTVGGTWMLTGEKLVGRSLRKPVLTLTGADGKVEAESSAKWGTLKPLAQKKGAFTLSLNQVYLSPKGHRADEIVVELDLATIPAR